MNFKVGDKVVVKRWLGDNDSLTGKITDIPSIDTYRVMLDEPLKDVFGQVGNIGVPGSQLELIKDAQIESCACKCTCKKVYSIDDVEQMLMVMGRKCVELRDSCISAKQTAYGSLYWELEGKRDAWNKAVTLINIFLAKNKTGDLNLK